MATPLRGRPDPTDPSLPGTDAAPWLQRVFDHAPTGIAVTDRRGRIVRCNDAYARLVGHPLAALAQVDFAEFVHPEDRAENMAALDRLLAGDDDFLEIENRYLRPDGTSAWVHMYVTVLVDEDGGEDLLLALVTDISERRRAEALRRETDEQFRAMFEGAALGVAHVDPDGRFVQVNPAFETIVGREAAELEALRFQDITHPADLDEDLALSADLGAGRIPSYSLRKRYLRPDGEVVWVNLTGSVVPGADGAPNHFVAVIEDITADVEREAAERRARELAELTAEVISRMDGVATEADQARAITETLVPAFADFATVEAPGEDPPLLAASHVDIALVDDLVELRTEHRLAAEDPASLSHVAAGERHRRETTPEVRDQYALARRGRELLDHLDPTSYVSVAIDLGGGRRGALLAARSDPTRAPYGDVDVAFLDRLAERVGVAFAGAHLRRAEHDIAVRLQQALLPDHLADAPGCEVGGRYFAIGEALEVGGDWYDSIALPDGRLLLVVGDVVGHGLEAAAVMGRLRAGLAALAARGHDPARLLVELDTFARSPQGGDFATVACAAVDPATGAVTYSSAGHPPLLVLDPWGEVEWLDDAGSVPLCTFPAEERPEATTVLAPGSLLVAFSDGLLERRGANVDEGLDRVAASLPRWRHHAVRALCDGVIAEVTADEVPEDDVVVLALRFGGDGATNFRRRIAGDPGELADLRADLSRWAAVRELDQATLDDLQLVVGEACANAVEHAYADDRAGVVEVTVAPAGDHLAVTVQDHGRWRTPGDHSADRGRGTGIMDALTRDFRRTTTEKGTVVTMAVPWPADGAVRA